MDNRGNFDKLDMLAELIDPIGEIITDRKALSSWKAGDRGAALKQMIRAHKPAVIRVLAAIEGEDPESYTLDGAVLLLKALAKFRELNELADALFPTPPQSAAGASSGAATDSIRDAAR